MIRILTLELLLFSLPFIVYGAWWLGTQRGRRAATGEGAEPHVKERMFTTQRSRWLAAAGVILVSIFIVFISLTTGHTPGGTYVAPHVVDGEIIPGHFEDEEQEEEIQE